MNKEETFAYYVRLYEEAKADEERMEEEERFSRRMAIYFSTSQTLKLQSGGTEMSKKPVTPYRKLCFELVEAQIDPSIPLAKVSPRSAENTEMAMELEDFINIESACLNSEDANDEAEREIRIQGTGVYYVDWDASIKHDGVQVGDIDFGFIRIADFIPQPKVHDIDKMEYCFIKKTMTVRQVKEKYGKEVQPNAGSLTSVDVVICWYLNDDGDVSKMVWVQERLELVYFMDNYFARKRRVCSQCGAEWEQGSKQCSVCGNKSSKYINITTTTVPEDILSVDTDKPKDGAQVYIPQGTEVPLYRIRRLPFVVRRNISKVGGSFYGVSDVDLLEQAQDGDNKIISKMIENVMDSGTIVTLPANTPIDNKSGSIRYVRIKDPRFKQLVGVFNMQANTQQDSMLNTLLYDLGRMSVGITNTYQGKPDNTAESGKAKEIATANTESRLESKFVNKASAYAKVYKLMFSFLLAFSDEQRKVIQPFTGVDVKEMSFSRYNYLKKNKYDEVYYNDDFIFATNSSYALSNRKEVLWKNTTQSFLAGAFGNPQDMKVVITYWNLMALYGYPLASKVLALIMGNQSVLPPEIEQALAQNPQLLQEFEQFLQAKALANKQQTEQNIQNNANIINPATDGGKSLANAVEPKTDTVGGKKQ